MAQQTLDLIREAESRAAQCEKNAHMQCEQRIQSANEQAEQIIKQARQSAEKTLQDAETAAATRFAEMLEQAKEQSVGQTAALRKQAILHQQAAAKAILRQEPFGLAE